LALIPYLLVAEETLVSQTVGSSSPHHDSIPTSPRIQPSSPQPKVSASPRNHLVSPQLDIQEPSTEPDKLPSPTREARNDVSMNIHPFYFSFNRSSLIRQELLFRRKLCHHHVIPLPWMTWLPKKEMKHLLARLYQRKIKQS
jgi:hypothetical protein